MNPPPAAANTMVSLAYMASGVRRALCRGLRCKEPWLDAQAPRARGQAPRIRRYALLVVPALLAACDDDSPELEARRSALSSPEAAIETIESGPPAAPSHLVVSAEGPPSTAAPTR